MPPKKVQKRKRVISKKNKTSPMMGVHPVLSSWEKKELAALVTPFSPEARGAFCCDESSSNCSTFTLNWFQQRNAPASGIFMVQMHPAHGTQNHPALSITENASPTAEVVYNPAEEVPLQNLKGGFRVVGMGLKIHSVSALQTREGRMLAGPCSTLLRTGVSTWTEATVIQKDIQDGVAYSIVPPDDGCQIRWQPCSPPEQEYRFNLGGTAYGKNSIVSFPTVYCTGWPSGQDYVMEAIAHCEYIPTNEDLFSSVPAPFGQNHAALLAVAARSPMTASGHSFWDFAKMAVKAAKLIAGITLQAAPVLEGALL